MEIIINFVNIVLHLDKYLILLVQSYGILTYVILFFIVFAETGLVVTPFLPGDSLLFAAGALSSKGVLSISLTFFLLAVAAILGDTVNYWIGYFIEEKIKNSPLIKKEYLARTHEFYEKHGAKTIILARFIPIIRTFAPFVAGVGKMSYGKFLSYNIIGGLLWVSIFTFGGFFFGNISFIQKNFSLVILAIIAISVTPIIFDVLSNLQKSRKQT